MQYGDIKVKNQGEIHFGGYVRRTFNLSWQLSNKLTVNQYQFVKWPDHGVPKTTSAFFRFHKAVMENYKRTGEIAPLLVHCSAGVGRTGAFVGYDILQGQTDNKTSVDIFSCVLAMRSERLDMVQTCSQYELLHKLMLEKYLFGDTDIDESRENGRSFPSRAGMEKEFALLKDAESFSERQYANQSDATAHRDNVVIIRQPENTDWVSIDATYVEAYNKTTQLIAAQSPLNSTKEYLLRAIIDNRFDTIVMLDKPSQRKGANECAQYWPATISEPLQFNNLTVILNGQKEYQGIVERQFTVSRNNTQYQDVTQYQYSSQKEINSRGVKGIKNLISRLHAQTMKKSSAAILVHCSDGLGKTGVFCALINIFERLKQENKIDVFRVVKDLKDLRPGMVQTQEQYKFCYEVVQDFLSSGNIYENSSFEADEVGEPVYENLQN